LKTVNIIMKNLNAIQLEISEVKQP